MSYQVLARKWRPHRFEDMVGQEHVLRALTNALDQNRLHHAYLFTGTRGVGKTTIARILAKSLNCLNNGVSATPCGECSACQDIDNGRFFDLIEVDAASRTKVEQTRELLENVAYAPTSGRFKVYLIDEVHMFSDHSFNALLKTLEEPPEHVKFLLATTDPQKIPVTVLSRCLQFSLKRLPERQIHEYLQQLLQQEQISSEQGALLHIARAADGSMRDALSLLDQAIAFGQGQVLAAEVESMLGRPSPKRILELLLALAEGDAQQTMQQVAVLAEYSPDYPQLLADMMSVLHQLAMLQQLGMLDETVVHDPQTLRDLSVRMTPEAVHLYYQIALLGRKDLAMTADPREGLEMILLRMLAFRPSNLPLQAGNTAQSSHQAVVTSPPTMAAPIAQQAPRSASAAVDPLPTTGAAAGSSANPMAALRAALSADDKDGAKKNTEKRVSQPQTVARQSDSTVATAAQRMVEPAAIESAASSNDKHATGVAPAAPPAIAPMPIADDSTTQQPVQPEPRQAAAVAADPAAAVTAQSTALYWAELVDKLGLRGIPDQLARHCAFLQHENGVLSLMLRREQEALYQQRSVQRLQDALSAYFNEPVRLQLDIGHSDAETPADIAARQQAIALQQARDSIHNDPIVKILCERLDATVQNDTIKPLKPKN